jgi:hypothetical protein
MDHTLVHDLSNQIADFKKLEESCHVNVEITTKQQSNLAEWTHQHYK